MRILRYLAKQKGMVAIIVALLLVQAFCDLSLPAYTSDIVDVGIQQGGIEDAVPSQMRDETWKELSLFMTQEEMDQVQSHYEEKEDGWYLTKVSQEERQQLNDIFATPMVAVYAMEQQEGTIQQVEVALNRGMMTKEQLQEQMDEKLQEMGANNDSMVQQMAVQFVKQEYQAMGLDTDAIQMRYLLFTGGKMVGLTLLSMVMAILAGLIASRVAAGNGMELREKVFSKVVSFSNQEIDQFSTASLITRSTNDIQQIQMVMVLMLRLVLYAPILGIGGIIKVAQTKTGMGWIIAVAVITIMALVGLLVSIAMPKFKKMQSLVDRLNLVSREILTGLSVIRAFSREEHEEARFDVANRDLMSTQLFTNRVMTTMMPAMMLIMNTISILIVWFGGHGVETGTMQVGDMMAFITYTMQIVMAFMMLTMMSIMLPRANVAAERIDQVLATQPTILDKPDGVDGGRDWKGEVEFHDVSFHFPGAEGDVLEHISFTAKPGQTTAFIGSTGSGKSTLVNLIPRFYDVTEGSITIDGVDLRDMSQHQLHELIGYVPQKGVLFSGTIESNLKFGGDHISDASMEQAADIAQATEFISEKKEGFQSPIAQGGSNVSGGQKQRLSIARAIAKDPKIYIFDDSFSALDYKTDTALRRALSQQVKDATVLIVAQRISTILHADRIIVLEEGRVVGDGTHSQLMQSCETYQEIARSQLSEKELGMEGGDAQ
jgi:ATP-binding cassette subfamily B multidrug efflux pump